MVGEAKELVGELGKILKRFRFRTDQEQEKLKFKLVKNIPVVGPGKQELFNEERTKEIEGLIEEYKEIRSQKGDLRPLVKKMDGALTEELVPYRRSKMWGYLSSFIIAASVALFLRAFAFEPFRIPSGSMIPTLQVGDYIYVNKFVYGLRVPFTQHPRNILSPGPSLSAGTSWCSSSPSKTRRTGSSGWWPFPVITSSLTTTRTSSI